MFNLPDIIKEKLQRIEANDYHIPKDKRKLKWQDIEDDVQMRSDDKDPAFRLKGKWKTFVEHREGFRVYAVDGNWVRNNLSVIFGHGGHGLVHEFIPNNEIWISTHHYHKIKNGVEIDCGCKLGNRKVNAEFFLTCTIHEISEYNLMKTGNLNYWTAHNISFDIEDEIDI